MEFRSHARSPYLSVYENIAFGLRARKAADAQVEEIVSLVAKLVDISDQFACYPREQSGGQRQRAAIGRVIVRDADLFLFDEPLSNLDANLRDGVWEKIKRLHSESGKRLFYVTHDQIEAMTLTDRIVLLRNGIIDRWAHLSICLSVCITRLLADFWARRA